MFDGPDVERIMAQLGASVQSMLEQVKPLFIERLRTAQESPDTRFVEVVGGEPVIDFERLFDAMTKISGL